MIKNLILSISLISCSCLYSYERFGEKHAKVWFNPQAHLMLETEDGIYEIISLDHALDDDSISQLD